MRVSVLKVSTGALGNATIRKGKPNELPSMQQGWKFSFDKRIKELSNATAYILTTDETPDDIEGCMIFQLVNKELPYIAFLEIAPHNKGNPKRYDYVAGCLIAWASRLSLTLGKGPHLGWMTFDVMEEDPKDQIKLMAVYSKKYGAMKFTDTTMLIDPDQADKLIKTYL